MDGETKAEDEAWDAASSLYMGRGKSYVEMR
jgi:hypothetical protein